MSDQGRDSRLASKTVCIATFTFKSKGERIGRTVYWRAIFEYFRPRAHRLFYIEQPLSYAEDKTPTMEVYQDGRLVSTERFPIPRSLAKLRLDPAETSFRLKILDVLSTIYFVFKMRTSVDLYIGIEPVNGLVGVFLSELGKVKSSIYCIMDYVPKRFGNPVMNGIFHALDRISVRFSDFAWNTSPMVEMGRNHFDGKQKGAEQLVVPVPCPRPYFSPKLAIATRDAVYVGTLSAAFGVDLLVSAFAQVVDEVPTARLHLVGDGPMRSSLIQFVKSNKLDNSIRFYGMLPDREADSIISESRVGAAPYRIDGPNCGFMYADNAKVKLYLAYGLPIIMPRRAGAALLVEKAGAGLIIESSQTDLAGAVKRLLTDDSLYETLHRNALRLSRELQPENIFGRALEPILSDRRDRMSRFPDRPV